MPYPLYEQCSSFGEMQKYAEFKPQYPEAVRGFCQNYLTILDTQTGTETPFEFVPWQWEQVIKPLFGWRDKKTGERWFQYLYCFLPRGNGKTTLLGSISSCLPYVENMPDSSQIALVSPTRKQSSILFNSAKNMLLKNGKLIKKGHIKIKNNEKVIEFLKKYVTFDVLTCENSNSDKLEGYCCIGFLDELEGLDAKTILTMGESCRKMPEPLLCTIGTVGKAKRGGVWDIFNESIDILEDRTTDNLRVLPVVHALKDQDDWEDIDTVLSVNPSVGYTINEQVFREAHAKAIKMPYLRSSFKRKNCNLWCSTESNWLNISKWLDCQYTDGDLENVIQDLPGYLGVDLSRTHGDLTSIVGVWWDQEINMVYTKSWFYTPSNDLETRCIRDDCNYIDYAEDGYINLLGINEIPFDLVAKKILEIFDNYSIRCIGMDRALKTYLDPYLEDIDQDYVTNISQGSALSQACNDLYNRIENGRIQHDGNKIQNYCVSNVALKTTVNGHFPCKIAASSNLRIDGVSALVTALKTALISGIAEKEMTEDDLFKHIEQLTG